MGAYETNKAKIIAQLKREGWVWIGGAKHDKYEHEALGRILIPRGKEISLGVARHVAENAGWRKK